MLPLGTERMHSASSQGIVTGASGTLPSGVVVGIPVPQLHPEMANVNIAPIRNQERRRFMGHGGDRVDRGPVRVSPRKTIRQPMIHVGSSRRGSEPSAWHAHPADPTGVSGWRPRIAAVARPTLPASSTTSTSMSSS